MVSVKEGFAVARYIAKEELNVRFKKSPYARSDLAPERNGDGKIRKIAFVFNEDSNIWEDPHALDTMCTLIVVGRENEMDLIAISLPQPDSKTQTELAQKVIEGFNDHLGQEGLAFTYIGPENFASNKLTEIPTINNPRIVLKIGRDGRSEIVRAIQRSFKNGMFPQEDNNDIAKSEEIDALNANLDEPQLANLDGIIYVGECPIRLSGALTFQSVYAEIEKVDDPTRENITLALKRMLSRERRFGGRPDTSSSSLVFRHRV